MNFLYPGFLFSLLAVAIPIFIHLFNFRKFKRVYFSNVQFLQAAQEAQASRSRLKDLLVLACRVLAIIFLVLAFAQPYFSAGGPLIADGNKLLNIYIDNSYSMGAVNKEGSLLDEAKRKIKNIAAEAGPNDKFRLITNDFEGRHQRMLTAQELISQLDEIKISAVQRNLQQVLNRLSHSDNGNSTVFNYIVSDFQKGFIGSAVLSGPANQRFALIRVQANTIPNIAVDSVWALSPAHRPADLERFVVQLHNYGEADGNGIPLKLVVNNQQKAASRLNIPAGKSIKDTLDFRGLSAGWQKAIVSIQDYPIVFDDELKFSFKVNTGLNILQISGDPSERYIKSLFAADPYFKLTAMAESAMNYSGFEKYQLIILSDLKSPSTGLAQQLKNFVQHGGSIIYFPDLDNDISSLNTFLQNLSLPAVSSLSKDTLKVMQIDLRNKLFNDVFEEMPAKIDLPKVNRHFNYTRANNSSREDLMLLPLGQSFFSRYQLAAGNLYLAATSLKKADSNFPEHPLFVPLLYKIAFNSAQYSPLYYYVGTQNINPAEEITVSPSQSLRLKSAEQEIIPEIRRVSGKTDLYISDQIKQAGFYTLSQGGSQIAEYAFNQTRSESDMHYSTDKEIQQVFKHKHLTIANSQAALSFAAVENNHTELWKLCIVLCAVFLITEVLLIRFFNKLKL